MQGEIIVHVSLPFLNELDGFQIIHSYTSVNYMDELTLGLLNPLQDKEIPFSAAVLHLARNIIRLIAGETISSLINLISWITNYLSS